MKFMKLGSKPDCFQSDGDNVRPCERHKNLVCVKKLLTATSPYQRFKISVERFFTIPKYMVSDFATDIVINVEDVKFYLYKFPLLSKCPRLQKLVANTNDQETNDEIQINDIPGGSAAFEACAKFCYGMTITLNAYNVVATQCAAEYLEMYETAEKGNLIYKIEVFLNYSIFKSWKDSIIVLQTTRYLLPWSEELKIVSHCLNSIASKASMDPSKVDWPYTYNRKKLSSENGNDSHRKHHQTVPMDWWVEDLCDLQLDLYKRVMTTIITKGNVSGSVIGEALNAYASRRLPGFDKGVKQKSDNMKYRLLLDTIIRLLPAEMENVSCSFLLKLLKAAIVLEYEEMEISEMIRRIGQNLEEATMSDLLIPAPVGETVMFDDDTVQRLVEEFLAFEQNAQKNEDALMENDELQEIRSPRKVSDTSKLKVAKLIDNYLAEIARDPNFPLTKFISIAQLVSSFPRPSHDGLYRAIDMYLKEHPKISKRERKGICRLMDCKKLSAEACMHAVQNERLPLRTVVQVLFFEQIRATKSCGGTTTTFDVPEGKRNLVPADVSHGRSRSTSTNTEEEWDALKGQLATLKLSSGGSDRSSSNDGGGGKGNADKLAASKIKGLQMSKKIISKIWSSRERNGEITSSDSSESPTSTVMEETKSTPSTSGRQSAP